MFSETTRKRIEQLIPRLASDSDGEIVSSVLAIKRVLANEGKDFHDLANQLSGNANGSKRAHGGERHGGARQQAPKSQFAEMAEFCAQYADTALREKEREFVLDMVIKLKYQNEPTPKQAAWLESIYAKLKRQADQHGEAAL